MVIRRFHLLADQEALCVLRELDYRFKPAVRQEKPVAMRFVMPIVFEE